MELFGEKDCLHCTIVREVGLRLENGEVSGKGALDSLILVMADVLATAPMWEADKMMSTVMQDLSEAEARARRRNLDEPAFARTGAEDERGSTRQVTSPAGYVPDEICVRE